jgi:hypothetical protein
MQKRFLFIFHSIVLNFLKYILNLFYLIFSPGAGRVPAGITQLIIETVDSCGEHKTSHVRVTSACDIYSP